VWGPRIWEMQERTPKNFFSLAAVGGESLKRKYSLKKERTTMNDQTYQIALSPDLHITLEEFAAAWNEDDIARTFAEAHLSQSKGTQFFDPMLVTVLLTVGAGVASDLLSDLMKGVIQRLIDK